MSDFRKESSLIQAELKTLDINHKETLNQNIVRNVNNQVRSAAHTFKSKVADEELIIIGMVYDMHNDFKFGNGQLILVNINNETDPTILSQNKYLIGLEGLVILGYKQ